MDKECGGVKRRTKWIIGASLGVPVLLVGGLLLLLQLTSPDSGARLADVEVKRLPDAWIEPEPAQEPAEPPPVEPPAEVAAPRAPSLDSFNLPLSGTLAMVGDDRPFGEEAFRIERDAEGVSLRAEGKFWFKALIATITLAFDQTLQFDERLEPSEYAATFDAPLGFDRQFQAEFNPDLAVIRSKDEVLELPIDRTRTFILGTFSTYAMIPLLYQLRESSEPVTLETLVFGGPPNSQNDDEEGLPELRIEQLDDGVISFDGGDLQVSRYRLSGNMGAMTLYARGAEFLGLYAGDDEESLFVYRTDYFKDGFDIR